MSTEIKKLRERMAELATEARAEFDKITEKTPESEAKEIEGRFDTIMADHDKLGEKAERLEKLAAAESRMKAGDPRAPRGEDAEARGSHNAEGPTYRDAFYELLRTGGDPSALDGELRQVLRGGVQSDAEFRTQNTGTNSAGGYTVPTELANMLIETMLMHGPMYDGNLTTEIVTSGGGQIDMPTIDDTANSGALHTEGNDLTNDGGVDATFGTKQLNAYVYDTEFIKWSMELGQDSIFNMEQLLNRLLGKRLGRVANSVLTTGSGSGQPHGIATAASSGTTAASATAITADELIDLYHSVDPAYRAAGTVRYMMNDTTLSVVRKLKDGDGNYLWQMGDIQKGIPQTLNGAPVVINQDMANIGASAKSILFGDFSAYFVRKVGSPVIGVMRERFWPNLGIAGLVRFDGELSDTAAVKALTQAAS